jgi:hypothetical protein
MKSLTTTSRRKLGGLIVLLAASVSLTACSSNTAGGSDQARLARANNQCADYENCVDRDGFMPFDTPNGERLSPGVNFGRWSAGASD